MVAESRYDHPCLALINAPLSLSLSLSLSLWQEEIASKTNAARGSRSPSVCKTPELTSESSSEEASGGDRYWLPWELVPW